MLHSCCSQPLGPPPVPSVWQGWLLHGMGLVVYTLGFWGVLILLGGCLEGDTAVQQGTATAPAAVDSAAGAGAGAGAHRVECPLLSHLQASPGLSSCQAASRYSWGPRVPAMQGCHLAAPPAPRPPAVLGGEPHQGPHTALAGTQLLDPGSLAQLMLQAPMEMPLPSDSPPVCAAAAAEVVPTADAGVSVAALKACCKERGGTLHPGTPG